MDRSIIRILISIICCVFLAGCGGSTDDKAEAAAADGAAEYSGEAGEKDDEEDPDEEDADEEDDADDIADKALFPTKSVKDEADPGYNDNDDPGEDETEIDETETDAYTPISEEECASVIDRLRESDPVHPAETEILTEMGGLVTFSKVIDEQGVIFSEMDNFRKSVLRRKIIDDVMWGESDIYRAIPIEPGEGRYNADSLVPLDEAKELFKEIYGEENFTPAEYEKIEDGYILISYGDGDPWHIVEHMQFFEDDDYFLLTGPAFYEDNGGTIEFKGYADILFRKNDRSRYGVTLLYGRYRNERIDIASVDTSSELPPSGSRTYTGKNLIDGDYSTIWAEGVPGTGIGETVTLHLDKARPVYGVLICNGYTASYEQYEKNGMLTDVGVDFGKGKTAEGHDMVGYGGENYTPEDLGSMNWSRAELEEPVITDTVTIKITGAQKGTKYEDTCVSEMRVY